MSPKTEFRQTEPRQTEPRQTEQTPVSRKYDTPAINELLLRIFGEEHRRLIHATLADLDAEYPQGAGSGVAKQTQTPAPTVAETRLSPDPFEAIGAELLREERLDFLEAFKR